MGTLKERFQDKASNFGKEYLKLLVDEIRIVKEEVHLSGSLAALAGALCSGSELGSLPFRECPVPSYIGSPARTRTTDMVVNSHPLYRLSYWGISLSTTGANGEILHRHA